MIVPRPETGLPIFPASHYPGPYAKRGVCLHNMGAHEDGPISLSRAKQITRVNYDYHLARWKSIDIMEAFDVYNVEGEITFLEGRPRWSNCDAFSGMAKLGYQYIGWEVSGDFNTAHPSDLLLEGLAAGLAQHYRDGWISEIHMKGHKDFNAYSTLGGTDCPGRNLYPHIPEIVAEAQRKLEERKEDDTVDLIKQDLQEKGQGIFKGKDVDVYTAVGSGGDYLHVRINTPDTRKLMVFINAYYPAPHDLAPQVLECDSWRGKVIRLKDLGLSPEEDAWISVHLLPEDSMKFRGFIRQ